MTVPLSECNRNERVPRPHADGMNPKKHSLFYFRISAFI